MGAALTYARRYALFTLVGIAGEDDIDAPDLTAPMPPASAAAKPEPNWHGRLNGGRRSPGRGDSKVVSKPAKTILGAEASSTLRDQLMEELKAIASSDDAAVWAHRILGAKNSLIEVDARQVEDAFRAKLATLDDGQSSPHTPSAPEKSPSGLAQRPLRRHARSMAGFNLRPILGHDSLPVQLCVSSVAIEKTRGSFGSLRARRATVSYQVKTPYGTLGIRG
jgi:ERF superfamily